MYEHQKTLVEGKIIRVVRPYRPDDVWEFATETEAIQRAAIVEEAMTWRGTPFVDCGDVKGKNGAVDCAMMLVRVFVDTGTIPPFDPRPYNPRFLLQSQDGSEPFLDWIEGRLGAKLIDVPQIGDVLVFHWGTKFAHGTILVNRDEVIHAYGHARMVLVSRREHVLLKNISLGAHGTWNRPYRSYSVWGR